MKSEFSLLSSASRLPALLFSPNLISRYPNSGHRERSPPLRVVTSICNQLVRIASVNQPSDNQVKNGEEDEAVPCAAAEWGWARIARHRRRCIGRVGEASPGGRRGWVKGAPTRFVLFLPPWKKEVLSVLPFGDWGSVGTWRRRRPAGAARLGLSSCCPRRELSTPRATPHPPLGLPDCRLALSLPPRAARCRCPRHVIIRLPATEQNSIFFLQDLFDIFFL